MGVGGTQDVIADNSRKAARRWAGIFWTSGLLALLVLVAGCRNTSPAVPQLPGGTYTNTQFHFSVHYPDGWQVNVAPQSSPFVPLNLTITRTGDVQSKGALISTFSVTIFNAADKAMATPIARLKSDKTLRATTIGGLAGYQATPVTQPIPGAQGSVTHTDYYVLHDTYEYQVSTDSVQSDSADDAMRTMLQSFAITK